MVVYMHVAGEGDVGDEEVFDHVGDAIALGHVEITVNPDRHVQHQVGPEMMRLNVFDRDDPLHTRQQTANLAIQFIARNGIHKVGR